MSTWLLIVVLYAHTEGESGSVAVEQIEVPSEQACQRIARQLMQDIGVKLHSCVQRN